MVKVTRRPTSSIRRQTYMKDLPRRASIPKFLLPNEILMVRELKEKNPAMGWEEAVERIVFDSVNVSELMVARNGSIRS